MRKGNAKFDGRPGMWDRKKLGKWSKGIKKTVDLTSWGVCVKTGDGFKLVPTIYGTHADAYMAACATLAILPFYIVELKGEAYV